MVEDFEIKIKHMPQHIEDLQQMGSKAVSSPIDLTVAELHIFTGSRSELQSELYLVLCKGALRSYSMHGAVNREMGLVLQGV